ncbi:hypothetical protein NDU88_000171 [Pleurodeles waltl]|uniref:Uncharacterized protein n=1 Tax=Pleurodeles waltl TaxID=8319 RepID=A0AAV7KM57_PLEWA|nr:hypothetical protein NDU88_000171 [Pleurodeles waltl]
MLHGRPHALCVACDPSGPAVTPQAIARDDVIPCLKAGCEAPHLGGPMGPDCWVLPLGPVSGWVGLKRFALEIDFLGYHFSLAGETDSQSALEPLGTSSPSLGGRKDYLPYSRLAATASRLEEPEFQGKLVDKIQELVENSEGRTSSLTLQQGTLKETLDQLCKEKAVLVERLRYFRAELIPRAIILKRDNPPITSL